MWYNGYMRWIVLGAFLFTMWPQVSAAQIDNSTLDIINEPICFAVRNEAPYTVRGSFITAQYQRPDGIVARHRSNFRLLEAGGVDKNTGELGDHAEFCSYGPFMPDRQLELTLRSLVPLFSCKTRIDQGEIVVKGYRKPEGGAKTWAECFDPDGTKTSEPIE